MKSTRRTVIASAFYLLVLSVPLTAQVFWTRKAPDASPGPRIAHAMAYDSRRGVTVLFGGSTSGFSLLGDTWEWDGTTWTQRMVLGPGPRFRHAMAYDSRRGVTVLFGGVGRLFYLNDTWEWDGTTWTQRTPALSPSPRYAPMAYDTARGVTVLFGGGQQHIRALR